MNDMMKFSNTIEEFMEQYKIVDTEQIYTNGAELVPIFRMKQWFDYIEGILSADKDDDTISRQAAIEAITDERIVTNMDSVYDSELHRCKRATHRILASLPSAERRGRWEKVDDNPYEYVGMCSVCRNEVKQPTCMLKPIYSYCPICGALMDKEEE